MTMSGFANRNNRFEVNVFRPPLCTGTIETYQLNLREVRLVLNSFRQLC